MRIFRLALVWASFSTIGVVVFIYWHWRPPKEFHFDPNEDRRTWASWTPEERAANEATMNEIIRKVEAERTVPKPPPLSPATE